MRVLVVNAGSSSLKHALLDSDARDPDAAVLDSGDERWEPGDSPGRHGEVLKRALAERAHEVDAIGHRVVHGGDRFEAPALVDDDVRAGIAEAARLAPLHNRAALEGIDAARDAFPDLPQVACFDTAFHRTLDPAAATYAIPGEWAAEHGIRRFGFHGLNVSWCAERSRELLGADGARRLVVCHLGSGCSVSAVRDGRSLDTSMGFTPLDGVPMATRSGALDPGVVLHLLRAGLDADALDDGLNHRAGLLGIAGSADLREVLAARDDDGERQGAGARDDDAREGASDDEARRAALAVAVFVRGIAGSVAAMTTALGGLDALVFTAGIGEHSDVLRAEVGARLAHLGVALDPARNAAASGDDGPADRELSPEGAKIAVWTLRAREEYVIARETAGLLEAAG